VPARFAYVLHAPYPYTDQGHQHRTKVYQIWHGLRQYQLFETSGYRTEMQSQTYCYIDKSKVPVLTATGSAMET
jgi:hypothetical protein